jgi:hypothetical protein
MTTARFICPPREPTVEEAKRFVIADKIRIKVSSTVRQERGRDGKLATFGSVKSVTVKNESEMKPELFIAGPKRRGEVNVYVGTDGHRHYFCAKTGEAIGSEMRPIPPRKFVDPSPALAVTR